MQKIRERSRQPKKDDKIACRRCKVTSFSMSAKKCFTCNYPGQDKRKTQPVQSLPTSALDQVRTGKLQHNSYCPVLIEVIVNDRMGKKNRIKCSPTDTVGQLKKLIAAQIGTRAGKIRLQKAYSVYKDHITLQDYEIKDGFGLQMYYE